MNPRYDKMLFRHEGHCRMVPARLKDFVVATNGSVMGVPLKAVQALNLWRGAIVESVRRDAPDLSARQMALLLTVYLTPPPHTVRGLAATLNVSKPAITRALDRLGEFGLVKRKTDDLDRRSVLIQRTVKGSVFLREFGDIIVAAGTEVSEASPVG
jgi:DNA-binding MarR family transcriptional regulator